MNLETSRRFNRDLRRLRDRDAQRGVTRKIAEIRAASRITEVSGVRRLTTPSGVHYRIRIGAYRLGVSLEEGTIVLERFLHRKDVYRYWP